MSGSSRDQLSGCCQNPGVTFDESLNYGRGSGPERKGGQI